MSRPPTPWAVALEDQILAVLRDAKGFPLSTADITAAVGAGVRDGMLSRLGRLRRLGRVEKTTMPGFRYAYWSIVTEPPSASNRPQSVLKSEPEAADDGGSRSTTSEGGRSTVQG